MGWGLFPPIFFWELNNEQKNSCLTTLTNHGVGMEFNWQKYFFTKNWMIYPDLHTKVMFNNPYPMGGGEGWRSIFLEFVLVANE